MKLTIDTTLKTVEVNDENLKEVVDFMSTLFPETWQQYKLTTSTNWTVYPGTWTTPTDSITYCTTNHKN